MAAFRRFLAALFGLAGLATASAHAASYTPTASVAALAAYGQNSPLIAHAIVYANADTVSYDWYASCPGSPDGSQYVAATGLADGCWVRLSVPNATIPGLADYLPLTGGTLSGLLTTVASTLDSAGLNIPTGTAPTSPNDGDVWITSLGMYAQVNGSTVGPFGSGGGGGSPGGSNGQVQWNNTGAFGGITGATTDGTTLTLASPVFSGTVSGSGTIPNSVLANFSMTIAGHSIALGGTQTIACGDLSNGAASCSTDATNAANISSGTLPSGRISGSYTGLTGTGTLTAGTIGSGFTAIANARLANSSMTIAGHSISLGGTQTIACGDLSDSGTLCTLNSLPLSDLASQAADTLVMNASGSSAAPTAVAMPTSGTNGCAGTTNALTYNTSTHALGCNTISGGGTGCIPPGTSGNILYDDGAGDCLDTTALTTDGTNVTASSFANSAIVILGSSTGKTTIASANAGATNYTLTLPAATDTLIGKATTDVLTNKTYDTAGTGNSFSINGVAVTTNTGTGAVARAASPTFTTSSANTAIFASSSAAAGIPILRSSSSGNLSNGSNGGQLLFGSYRNSDATVTSGAVITGVATQAWTVGTNQGDSIQFFTTPNSSTTLTLGMTLGQDATLALVGSTTVAGNIFNAGITTDSAQTTASVCEDTTSHRFYFGSGTLGICKGTSSRRFKHNIKPLTPGLNAILALKPMSFYMNKGYGDPKKQMYGFIAEDAVKVLPKLTGHDAKGKVDAFDYLGVVPVLVKAVQQQEREIRQQQIEISELKSELRKVH